MRSYRDSIIARCAEQDAQRQAKRDAEAKVATDRWSDRLTPLEDRLAKLLSSVPKPVLDRGLSLEALRRMLSGKWRGNAHPGELGTALRKLGFSRHRDWSDAAGGFRAKWFKEQN
jgi:hypothetical protein